VFADDPLTPVISEKDQSSLQFQLNQVKGENDCAPAIANGDVRPDADSFVFTDVSAFVYKEWAVVKKNKFGRKQPRVLGEFISQAFGFGRGFGGWGGRRESSWRLNWLLDMGMVCCMQVWMIPRSTITKGTARATVEQMVSIVLNGQ